MKPSRSVIVLLIIAACFISRLPILLSPELILDGDECIVAMMARHTLQGKGMPMFFYGQNYGFAFIEVLSILPFYLLMGVGTYAVKFAMLSLWTTGVVFFYLALKQLATNYKWFPLLTTLLLIVCPSWAVFSMKAYGGYITAFTLSNIVLYLLFNEKYNNKTALYITIGILLALIYQSHVLWLPALMPFLAYHFYKNGNLKKVMPVLIPLIIVTIAFHFYRRELSVFNISGRYNPKNDLVPFTLRIPSFLYRTMHGHHELWMAGGPGWLCGTFAGIMTLITLVLPVIGIVYFFKDRKSNWLFIASVVAILFNLGYTIFTYRIQGKYMLPMQVYTLLSLFIFLSAIPFKKWIYVVAINLVVWGVLCMGTFKPFSYPKTSPGDLTDVLENLQKNDVQYVYGTQGMLVWQLIFYSNEKILARPYKYPGRYPEYGRKIDSAYIHGLNTAVVGYTDTTHNEYEFPGGQIFGNMFIYLNPSKEQLIKRFEFKEGEIYPVYK
jgi:hypothetical protein